MAGAGARNKLITIERVTATTDAFGGESEAWGELRGAWANVRFGSGEERRQAAQENAAQAAAFQLLASAASDLTTADRIRFMGATWDILGIAPDQRGATIDLAAVRRA